MAEIAGFKEMQEKLQEVKEKIRVIESLNDFLAQENHSNDYIISFGKTKVTVCCEDKNSINQIVINYKNRIVGEVREIAQRYSILLDEEDNKILDELFIRKKAAKKNNSNNVVTV